MTVDHHELHFMVTPLSVTVSGVMSLLERINTVLPPGVQLLTWQVLFFSIPGSREDGNPASICPGHEYTFTILYQDFIVSFDSSPVPRLGTLHHYTHIIRFRYIDDVVLLGPGEQKEPGAPGVT